MFYNVLHTCIWCSRLFQQNPRSVCLQNELILILKHIQAIMTMVPEAWQDNSLMSQDKQDFYRWISCSMEPWDGPGMYRLDQQLKAYLDRLQSAYSLKIRPVLIPASEIALCCTLPWLQWPDYSCKTKSRGKRTEHKPHDKAMGLGAQQRNSQQAINKMHGRQQNFLATQHNCW